MDESRTAAERAELSAVLVRAGLLLADPAATWPAWMERYPGHADVVAATHEMVSVLKHDTNWELNVLLERLGCTARESSDIQRLGVDQLRLCTTYFEWVHTLMEEVDTVDDRRGVVEVGRRVLLAADGNVAEARAAIEDGGEFPAVEYLRLGELSHATRQAIASLETREGARMRATMAQHPFREQLAPHLSLSRIVLLDEQPHVLGDRVAMRMSRHLREECGLCRDSIPPERRPRMLAAADPPRVAA